MGSRCGPGEKHISPGMAADKIVIAKASVLVYFALL